MREITSNQNPVVKAMRELRESRARQSQMRMLVEGEKMIREAAESGLKVYDVLVDAQKWEKYAPVAQLMEDAGANVYAAPLRVIEAVCDTKTPQGVVASFALPASGMPEGMLVALDGVQDPGNVGTIWRTADAAGFGGLLVGEGSADPFSQKVQRSAMSSAFRVPVKCGNMVEMLLEKKAQGYRIVASALDGTDFRERIDAGEKAILIVGSEARGISPEVMALADVKLRIPMLGKAESLNAAVAAGIFMYQMAVFKKEK